MSRTPRRVAALYYFLFVLALQSAAISCSAHLALAQEIANPDAPAITKVEPPNWWVNLTPDVMLLLTGKNLQVTHANCNLPDVIVSRTQSMADGHYLFVWLRLSPNLKSGTAICRVTTPKGQATFELPLAARSRAPPLRPKLAETDTGNKYGENESRFQCRNTRGKHSSLSSLWTNDFGQLLSCNLSHLWNLIDAVDTNFPCPK